MSGIYSLVFIQTKNKKNKSKFSRTLTVSLSLTSVSVMPTMQRGGTLRS